jgi:hypothetical protein
MGVLLPDRLYCTRVNAPGRAMRTWIDRTIDGLSGMPADGISLPPKRGTSARPAGAARRLGYINGATGRKGGDRLWHEAAGPGCPLSSRYRVVSGP